MKILWSLPMRGERLDSGRGDLVRAKRLIEAMRKIGHEVCVVEFGSPTAVSVYRKIIRRMLPCLISMMIRDAGRWMASIRHAQRVARQAADFGADVLVETQAGFSISGAVAAERIRLPLILDDCSPSHEEKVLGAGFQWLAHRTLLRQTKTAALVVVTSRIIAENLVQEGVPQKKIRLFSNGVDLHAHAEVDREKLRKRLGLADYCVIGFAGSFQPWHETDLLAAALGELRDNSTWHLLLVGDGLTQARTLQTLHSLGLGNRVTATGAIPHDRALEFITCFDIGVLPGSNHYGHPMKLVEYAAAGIASIAPNLPPVREVAKEMQTGLLFEPGNKIALVRKLEMLVGDAKLRKILGDQARRSVTVGDDWCTRARELTAAIEPLLVNSGTVQQIHREKTSEPALVSRMQRTGYLERGGE